MVTPPGPVVALTTVRMVSGSPPCGGGRVVTLAPTPPSSGLPHCGKVWVVGVVPPLQDLSTTGHGAPLPLGADTTALLAQWLQVRTVEQQGRRHGPLPAVGSVGVATTGALAALQNAVQVSAIVVSWWGGGL